MTFFFFLRCHLGHEKREQFLPKSFFYFNIDYLSYPELGTFFFLISSMNKSVSIYDFDENIYEKTIGNIWTTRTHRTALKRALQPKHIRANLWIVIGYSTPFMWTRSYAKLDLQLKINLKIGLMYHQPRGRF